MQRGVKRVSSITSLESATIPAHVAKYPPEKSVKG